MNQKSKLNTLASMLMLSLFFIIFSLSCKKNKAKGIKIGDSYEGGIVAYILRPGETGYDSKQNHGLIIASFDQSPGVTRYDGVKLYTGTLIGTGKDNTATINASSGEARDAASLCARLVLGGKDDWYLPSKDELNRIYENAGVIGGFDKTEYWTSSQDGYWSWIQDFFDGYQSHSDKYGSYSVRAIRAF